MDPRIVPSERGALDIYRHVCLGHSTFINSWYRLCNHLCWLRSLVNREHALTVSNSLSCHHKDNALGSY